jgi:hypothetical protein
MVKYLYIKWTYFLLVFDMNPQNLNDFEEWNQSGSIQSRSRLLHFGSKSLPQVFKLPETNKDMTTDESIHDYQQSLKRSRHNIKMLQNDETAIRFLDHLGALGLSSSTRKLMMVSHVCITAS